ncbi:MAG: hypothetical protein GX142_03415 [Chloroflexi bacterium]|nr:hypothetical protein [Chloroflexota bacterium]
MICILTLAQPLRHPLAKDALPFTNTAQQVKLKIMPQNDGIDSKNNNAVSGALTPETNLLTVIVNLQDAPFYP